MKQPIEAHAYAVADALDLTLFFVKDGADVVARGACTRTLLAGGLKLEAMQTIRSDVVSEDAKRGGYYAQLYGPVWAYLVATDLGKGVAGLEMHVFDATIAGLKVKDLADFGGVSIADTIAKLAPAIKATFTFDTKQRAWKKHDVPHLDDSTQAQGSLDLIASPQG